MKKSGVDSRVCQYTWWGIRGERKKTTFAPFVLQSTLYADDCGDKFNPKTLDALNEIRETTKKRYRIISAYRSPKHNKKVGGVSKSQHTKGVAVDLWVPHSHRADLYSAAKSAGFSAFGWGNNSVHIDQGRKRWWTYDDSGNDMSGDKRMKYLHKAPDNFKKDWGLK